MIFTVLFVATLVSTVALYLQHPKFGQAPDGARLARLRQSPHHKKGAFRNHTYTPALSEGHTVSRVMYSMLFQRNKNKSPKAKIPSVYTDLKQLPVGQNLLVWLGHSSYFLKIDGVSILVDPVLSGNASPVPGSMTAFDGADRYRPDDMPTIDYLFITHDHYDHLDYKTIVALRQKVGKVYCGLGVGGHLERWGYASEVVTEMDWGDKVVLAPHQLTLYAHTARHFSGRLLSRNNTLWLSFLLESPTYKLYIGGDSGYDHHFKTIGEQHGTIDLAILENGQYNKAWKEIHFHPGENLQAAQDLRARRLMPVHSGKFALANHDWDEPLREMARINQALFSIPLVTPLIGEPVFLNNENQPFTDWWQQV
jgi:L-ascorbate metabolism protein UlaG (beta-lactamase superfamily)